MKKRYSILQIDKSRNKNSLARKHHMHYCFQQPTSQKYNLKGATKYEGVFCHRRLKFSVRSFKKSNLFWQIMPELSSISLLLYSFSGEALTAKTTSNVINGSAPYFTFDGGRTLATNVEELMAITLPDGTRITPSTNPSNPSNPIQLPNVSDNLADIVMSVPVGADSVALNALIGPPNNYWIDDDGDGQGSGGITVTGDLALSIIDKAGRAVDRRDSLDICSAPYKITLSSSGGRLSTRYGFPRSRRFSASSATYYINPKASPTVCFARPNLNFASDQYAGPSNIWNPADGFLVQSTESSGYHRNFPTTGANNLYFDLAIEGVNENQLSWSPVTHSGITASMTPNSSTSVRVTLTGPHATSSQMSSSSPGNIPRPSLPATFELVGRDSRGNAVIKYGFELKQWFVNRGDGWYNYSSSLSWCNSIGYSMPRVRDLTNSVQTGSEPISGASPSSSGNYYMRHVDAGFFSEWGDVNKYTGASFAYDSWTSEASGSQQFYVYLSGGRIGRISGGSSNVVCASDLRP
jgi:hypothetical protein